MSEDKLRFNFINSLPHPLMARFCGDKDWWPVHDIEVQTGLVRIDVCGLLEAKSFGEVMEIRDGSEAVHDCEIFWTDWDAPLHADNVGAP